MPFTCGMASRAIQSRSIDTERTSIQRRLQQQASRTGIENTLFGIAQKKTGEEFRKSVIGPQVKKIRQEIPKQEKSGSGSSQVPCRNQIWHAAWKAGQRYAEDRIRIAAICPAACP